MTYGIGELVRAGTCTPKRDAFIAGSKEERNGTHYLVEFADLTRTWYQESWVEPRFPERKLIGNTSIGKSIEMYETADWITLKVDGEVVYDGHNLDGNEMLDVLDIEHTYAYYDNIEQFIQAVGRGETRA